MAFATGAAASNVDFTIQAGARLVVTVPSVDTSNVLASTLEIKTRSGRLLLAIAQGTPATIGLLRYEATAAATAALRLMLADFPARYDVRVAYTDGSYDRIQQGSAALDYGVAG